MIRMVKKLLESKNEELTLAAQVIQSVENARMKRPSVAEDEQSISSKKKRSHKSHKLDKAKLIVKQQEKNRRLARKKLRQSKGSIPSSEEKPKGTNSSVTSSNIRGAPDRRMKRVSFI
ncbi:hypothetical protein RSOLAG22IIIB_03959 [Rhizoctonia solani]|uniref:Uncharacterized protein n=1 Tax=Rhizoctonia solani TaxID=456999 RepID=A0A0K6FTH4_9AGAM|nr:hypothetical protein RSOLAG22IIIB_03959 [Rhizoctonia solani]